VGKAFRGSDERSFDARVELGAFRGLARRVGETGLELGRDGARDRAGVPGAEVLRNNEEDIRWDHGRHSRRK
jgi:hypothetical protein